jgi:hypothetical protein
MAKVKFGAVISDTRGSVGGITFSRARSGSVVRASSNPRFQQTARTQPVRSSLANLSKRWFATLIQAQRALWILLAAANPVTDVFGNTHVLTGQQFYIRVNQLRTSAGLAYIDDAPADQAVIALLSLSVVATAPATLTVTFTGSPLDGSHRLYIYASPSLSPGKVASKKDCKFIGVSGLAQASTFAAGALYTARFGNMIATKLITVFVAAFRDDRGVLSPFLTASDPA